MPDPFDLHTLNRHLTHVLPPPHRQSRAIAIFYAAGTLVGGVGAPALCGALIGAGSREPLFWGYGGGGILMVAAAVIEALIGVNSEGQSLETISTPLSAQKAG